MYIQCQVFLIKKKKSRQKTSSRWGHAHALTTVSRGQRGSLRGCCKRPSYPALRSAVRWVKRSARTMASPNGNGKTLFFCFRRRSLRNGADCDCQGGKGGDFRKEILPVPWLAQSGTGGISHKTKTISNYRRNPKTQLWSVLESPSLSPLPLSWRTGRK